MTIQHAIIPINKTCKQSQALHKAFKAYIQQETLANVTQTRRQKEEAIHRIQHLWQPMILTVAAPAADRSLNTAQKAVSLEC